MKKESTLSHLAAALLSRGCVGAAFHGDSSQGLSLYHFPTIFMREWIQQFRVWLTGAGADEQYFKMPLLPNAFADPGTVMAFSDGEFCVAVMAKPAMEGQREPHRNLYVSFSLRKPMPKGNWAGVFDVPGGRLRDIKQLIDEAAEYIAENEDE